LLEGTAERTLIGSLVQRQAAAEGLPDKEGFVVFLTQHKDLFDRTRAGFDALEITLEIRVVAVNRRAET
jgi:hypothetical protein